MNLVTAQQVVLDNALVALEKQLKIEKYNVRIKFSKPQRETTYQVILDALKLSSCHPTFLITAEVPDIICTSPGEHLLLSSIGASLGSPQVLIDSGLQELKSCGECSTRRMLTMLLYSIKDSKAYKIYLDFATGKTTPKKERNFKKIASPSHKLTTVLEEEPIQKPKRAKKSEPTKQAKTAKKTTLAKRSSTMQIVGVVIRDTPGVYVSKKKAQAKVDRGKGMDLLSDVALLEAAQLKKVLKKSKQDTHMLHASGSDDGVGSQPKVPDELKEKRTGINEGTGTIPGVLDEPKDQSKSENESWGDSGDDDDSNDDDIDDNSDDDKSDDEEEEKQDDEFVHTPDDYVPTNDETNDESKVFDEEEYEELYGDFNISLKYVEHADKEKGPIPSSSISSDYAAKYLNFDNIPPVDTEVVSMLDINVQHEVPHTSPLLTIPVSVIQ
ncbi:hypothetical protein Tco_1164565 [Tanacetum coccineum]